MNTINRDLLEAAKAVLDTKRARHHLAVIEHASEGARIGDPLYRLRAAVTAAEEVKP